MIAVPEGGDRVPADIVSGGRWEEMREEKKSTAVNAYQHVMCENITVLKFKLRLSCRSVTLGQEEKKED